MSNQRCRGGITSRAGQRERADLDPALAVVKGISNSATSLRASWAFPVASMIKRILPHFPRSCFVTTLQQVIAHIGHPNCSLHVARLGTSQAIMQVMLELDLRLPHLVENATLCLSTYLQPPARVNSWFELDQLLQSHWFDYFQNYNAPLNNRQRLSHLRKRVTDRP